MTTYELILLGIILIAILIAFSILTDHFGYKEYLRHREAMAVIFEKHVERIEELEEVLDNVLDEVDDEWVDLHPFVSRESALRTSESLPSIRETVFQARGWGKETLLAEERTKKAFYLQSNDGLNHIYPGDDDPNLELCGEHNAILCDVHKDTELRHCMESYPCRDDVMGNYSEADVSRQVSE